jgi:glucose-1-phosphate thymidylyltransferase
MPVFDKPMIYYPLSVLIESGIREIMVITTPQERDQFRRLLGDGSQWGLRLEYGVQERPEGIAQAFLIAEDFLGGGPVALILGDNLFHGVDFAARGSAGGEMIGAHIFAYPMENPSAYGVVTFDDDGRVLSIVEKPERPASRYAVPGLYLYDGDAVKITRDLEPSDRGEFEITAVNEEYLRRDALTVSVLERGTVWLDTGTFADLANAAEYVRVVEQRHGVKVGCVDEAAWRAGFIDDARLRDLAGPLSRSGYGDYLLSLLNRRPSPRREGHDEDRTPHHKLVVARRPDDRGESSPQRSQRPLEVGELLPDVTGDQEPAGRRFRLPAVDDGVVFHLREMQVTDDAQGSVTG